MNRFLTFLFRRKEKSRMKKYSDLYPPDQIIRCDCGSTAFFDWGVRVLTVASWGPSERNKDFTSHSNVQICTECLKPIIVDNGVPYDATEFVSADKIKALIQRGQAKEHVVPERVMDP